MKGDEKEVMHSKERILRSRSSPAGSEVFHSRGKKRSIISASFQGNLRRVPTRPVVSEYQQKRTCNVLPSPSKGCLYLAAFIPYVSAKLLEHQMWLSHLYSLQLFKRKATMPGHNGMHRS